MKNSSITNAFCEALPETTSIAFDFSPPPLNSELVPFTEEVQRVLDQFPNAGFMMVASIILIWFLTFRFMLPKGHKFWLKLMVIPLSLAVSSLIVAIAGSYWLVPKTAEVLWQNQQQHWIEPTLAFTENAAKTISKKISISQVSTWSHLMTKLYDHHTARLTLEYVNNPREAYGALELIDTMLYRPKVRTRWIYDSVQKNHYTQINLMQDALIKIAHQSFIKGDEETSLRLIRQGLALFANAIYEKTFLYPVIGQQARKAIKKGEYKRAESYVYEIPSNWENAAYNNLIEDLQQKLMVAALQEGSEKSWNDTLIRSQRLLTHSENPQVNRKPSALITCNIAYLHGLSGIKKMGRNQPLEAIKSLEKAKQHVSDSSIVTELLPIAYYRVGVHHMEKSKYQNAALSFTEAHKLSRSRNFACDAATAWRLAASEWAYTGNVEKALSDAGKAYKICPDKAEDTELIGDIELRRALRHMQFGRWKSAKKTLRRLVENPYVNEVAQSFLSDLDAAQSRHHKLTRSKHMGRIPSVSGQYCAHFTESQGNVTCLGVTLFDGKREVGRSSDRLTNIIFNQPRGFISVYDSLGNGRYNTFENQVGSSIKQLIDMDGDARPDFEQKFLENQLISVTQLSGRVSVHFAGGVVNKRMVDIFSRPDIFLVIYKNGKYFGRTETADNSTRPSWKNFFVINYRYRDTIDIFAVDEDLFQNDLVDKVRFDALPHTNYVSMDGNNMVLAVEVQPSDKPEGRYTGKRGQSVFSDPNFLKENTPLAKIVQQSYAEDFRADVMSVVAAIVVPEAAILTLMRRARFAEHFIAAWLGFEVTYSTLNKSNSDSINQ